MLQELTERLARAAEEMARLEKLERRVEALRQDLAEARATAQRLRAQLAKEEADVAALEGVSLTNLVVSLFGSKDEKLYKERQEAVAVQIKHDEAARRAEAFAVELEEAEAERSACAAVRPAYETLLAQKAQAIEQSSDPRAAQLFSFTDREQAIRAEHQELLEAINAGARAGGALNQVENALRGAAGMGTWDMLGGGMIATALKHSRLDEAQRAAYQAQQALQGFRRELQDVRIEIAPESIGLDGFSRFADYFFDNLLTDWMIQNRINDSLERTRSQRLRVENLIDTLARRQGALQADLDQLRRERAAFVEQFRP